METILFFIIVIAIIAAILVAAWYLLPVIVVIALILWIINKFKSTKKPADIPDNPFEEIYGNSHSNPFEDDFQQTNKRINDVIDVEYTEYEDDSNDQA